MVGGLWLLRSERAQKQFQNASARGGAFWLNATIAALVVKEFHDKVPCTALSSGWSRKPYVVYMSANTSAIDENLDPCW